MKPSTLQEVLLVEKRLREDLDVELRRASDWLEARRRELSDAHEARLAQLREDFARDCDTARARVRAELARSTDGADTSGESPDEVNDETLGESVRAAIVATLPGSLRAH
jgi:hypothetical protein